MTEINVSAIYNYDQTLLGREKSMMQFFFHENLYGADGVRENALAVLRYAVEDLLRWTPKMMVDQFNGEIIRKMKLEKVILALNRDFPVQLNKKKDYFYYAHMLYPDIIRVSDEYLTIKTYKDLLAGKIQRLQKGFLEGDEGEGRIRLCLNYQLNLSVPTSIRGLYYDFANTQRANKILSDWKLNTARRAHYKHPIDFLHESLPEDQRDEFLYRYYKFRFANEQSRQLRRESGNGLTEEIAEKNTTKEPATGKKTKRKQKTEK